MRKFICFPHFFRIFVWGSKSWVYYLFVQHANIVYNMDMSTVQSVERAFSILNTLGNFPQGAGAAELAEAVDLPRPTVIRLLNTMQDVGVVERPSATNKYQLGEGILALAAQVPFSRQVGMVARPFLQQLAQQVGETVYLSILDGHQTYYIEQINGNHHIQPIEWVGARVPLHVVADGKLFLAHWPTVDVARYGERPLATFTPKTIDNLESLKENLAMVRERGYAITRDEFEEGLIAVAAPVFGEGGGVITAVTIGGPAYRFKPEQVEEYAQLVVQTANAISERLKR